MTHRNPSCTKSRCSPLNLIFSCESSSQLPTCPRSRSYQHRMVSEVLLHIPYLTPNSTFDQLPGLPFGDFLGWFRFSPEIYLYRSLPQDETLHLGHSDPYTFNSHHSSCGKSIYQLLASYSSGHPYHDSCNPGFSLRPNRHASDLRSPSHTIAKLVSFECIWTILRPWANPTIGFRICRHVHTSGILQAMTFYDFKI